ncbi:uncharacterized protein LOC134720322 [Mytilus trossulus]|uniref:uncharacterized protein LOC134720322 n=1 Tax=Mytilus trossulus TaxID=6551 RepID=UPI00300711A6
MVTTTFKILLWVIVLYLKALPCVSQSSFRGTYYSGKYVSESNGAYYNEEASNSVHGPNHTVRRWIYRVIATVCGLFFFGLIYFLIKMCGRTCDNELKRRANRRNILMSPLNDIEEQCTFK